jgi:glycine/D-amino acid oxidase-like deaminating enzyme
MGSRGLTFAALCAELLAARLHAEPLPVELRLAETGWRPNTFRPLIAWKRECGEINNEVDL